MHRTLSTSAYIIEAKLSDGTARLELEVSPISYAILEPLDLQPNIIHDTYFWRHNPEIFAVLLLLIIALS